MNRHSVGTRYLGSKSSGRESPPETSGRNGPAHVYFYPYDLICFKGGLYLRQPHFKTARPSPLENSGGNGPVQFVKPEFDNPARYPSVPENFLGNRGYTRYPEWPNF